MIENLPPETLWLNVTNIVLGLATALALLVIGAMAVAEIMGRVRGTSPATERDPHIIHVPGLGATMADGGDPSKQNHD